MPEWTVKPAPDETLTQTPQSSDTPPPKRRARRRSWVRVIAVLLLLAVTGFLYYQHEAAERNQQAKTNTASRPIPVLAAAASRGEMGIYVEALGTVTPVYTVTVTSRVQGQIMEVYYREGQMVRKGDPLLEIDPRPYEAAVTQAEGQLAHDTALLNEARIDLDRYRTALSRNAIAQQQVYDQEQTVKQYEGTVQNDQGALDNAKVNLAYCHITSPIDGRVGLRLVDPGNIVQANSTTALVVITQLQPITVIFSVAEDYLSEIEQQLRQGQKLKVDALDRTLEKTITTGTLLTIDNQVDTTTGTVKLKAIFDNHDNALFPSQFVNAKLLVKTEQNVVLVPTPAIQRNSQQAFVYLIGKDQTATVKNITAGSSDGNFTAVEGIQPGDVVAINGFDKLQDGIKVEVRSGPRNQKGSSSTASGDQAP
ncbi:MAG TPA: efflux RND transporter periplasmic adaptor subunit [Candidatus Acidoferrales bacterium]|nr:efflux RND transporter periplasmic adaptor subunit [Candidatus Acidoferrales bacterium]